MTTFLYKLMNERFSSKLFKRKLKVPFPNQEKYLHIIKKKKWSVKLLLKSMKGYRDANLFFFD